MQEGSNSQSKPGQNSGKPERPPVNKKSKTTLSNSDDSQTPAVRRLSPTPSFNSTASSSTTTTSDAVSFNFSDRDYIFPSNLGPYSTRRSVSVKSSSSSAPKSLQKMSPFQLPVRSASMPHNDSRTDTTGSPQNKPKLRADTDLKALSIQASASSSLGLIPSPTVVHDGENSCRVQKCCSIKNYWKVQLVSRLSFSIMLFSISHLRLNAIVTL